MALDGNLPSFLSFGKNGALTAPQTNFELTTVNGSQNGAGWRMPLAGVVTHLSAQFDASSIASISNSVTVEMWKNGIATGVQLVIPISATGNNGNSLVLDPFLSFDVNDTLGAYYSSTSSGSGSLVTGEFAVLIRILN